MQGVSVSDLIKPSLRGFAPPTSSQSDAPFMQPYAAPVRDGPFTRGRQFDESHRGLLCPWQKPASQSNCRDLGERLFSGSEADKRQDLLVASPIGKKNGGGFSPLHSTRPISLQGGRIFYGLQLDPFACPSSSPRPALILMQAGAS